MLKTAAALVALALLATPALAQGGGMGAMIMAQDANGDGAITRAEAEAARAAMFARLDANRDGSMQTSERPTGQMAQMVARADSNNDGVISRAEYMAQPYRLFDRLDGNNNGTLEASELAMLRAMGGGR